MNLKRYDRDYRGDLIPRAEGPLCLYSEVHDMSEALTLACAERDDLLAECETLRRKARAFDYITACHMHYDGRVYAFNGFAGAETGAGKTITAAFAAEETT